MEKERTVYFDPNKIQKEEKKESQEEKTPTGEEKTEIIHRGKGEERGPGDEERTRIVQKEEGEGFRKKEGPQRVPDERTVIVEREVQGPVSESEQITEDRIRIPGKRREEPREVTEEETEVYEEKEKVSLPPARPGYLLAIHGPIYGKRFPLGTGTTRIGRDRNMNEIVLPNDPKASRRHATISVVGGNYSISDKRSRNRTYVNQKQLGESDDVILHMRDEIEIGETIFRFVEEGEWDFSWPKKAGVFMVRWRYPLFLFLSFLLFVGMISLSVFSWNRIRLIKQVPSPLQVKKDVWSNLEESSSFSGSEELLLHSSPGILHLKQEGKNRVLLVHSDGRFSLLDGERKEVVWRGDPEISISEGSSPTLSDVNGDGSLDLIIATRTAQVMAVDGRSGITIWRSSSLGGNIESTPAVGDLDGDGKKDVVVASVGGQVHFGYMKGTNPEWKAVPLEERVYSSPTLADFDADGILEVLIGTDEGMLYGFDGKTREKKIALDVKDELSKRMGVKFEEDLQFRSPCGAGDMTGDGTPDMVAIARQGMIFFFDGKTRNLLEYKKFNRPERLLPERHSAPLLADLDGDKNTDAIATSNSGEVYAFRKGIGGIQVLWEFSLGSANRLIGTPALGDVNKDGFVDVVIGGEDGRISILNGRSGISDRLLWQDSSEGIPITSSPLLSDVNGDGSLDILVMDVNHKVSFYKTNSRVFKNEVLWGMLYGFPTHTGNLFIQPRHTGILQTFFVLSIILLLGTSLNFIMVRARRRKKIERK